MNGALRAKRELMAAADSVDGAEVRCPRCQSDAVYRYGRTKNGKQRFMCIVCGRQFCLGLKNNASAGKPTCPACGNPMHIYMKEPRAMRFRCSRYPACRTYLKTKSQPEEIGQ